MPSVGPTLQGTTLGEWCESMSRRTLAEARALAQVISSELGAVPLPVVSYQSKRPRAPAYFYQAPLVAAAGNLFALGTNGVAISGDKVIRIKRITIQSGIQTAAGFRRIAIGKSGAVSVGAVKTAGQNDAYGVASGARITDGGGDTSPIVNDPTQLFLDVRIWVPAAGPPITYERRWEDDDRFPPSLNLAGQTADSWCCVDATGGAGAANGLVEIEWTEDNLSTPQNE